MQARERPRRPGFPSTVALSAMLLLATACGRKHVAASPPKQTTSAVSASAPRPTVAQREPTLASDVVATAAEADLERDGTVPKGATFRGIAVWPQATQGRIAVCGQTNPFSSDRTIFVPFVSVLEAGKPAAAERFIGRTTDDADRVYEAITAYCFAGGGPVPSLNSSPQPIPPLPNNVGRQSTPIPTPPPPSPSAPNAPVAASAAIPARATAGASAGTVTMRQDGNLHAAPHGATLRVVPAGTALQVFATAPGGWLQVGAAAPEGWVHESMVAR